MNIRPQDVKGETILISPLNWGLGHATRLVPLIRQLLPANEIIVAGEHPSVNILRKEFPNLFVEELTGEPFSFDEDFFSIRGQIKFANRLFSTIKEDKAICDTLTQKHNVTLVISDNRYGFYSTAAKNILITHQLHPVTPYGKIAGKVAAIVVKRLLKPFDTIWIPDDEKINLAGNLDTLLCKKCVMIGILSRLNNKTTECNKKYDYGVIISGPEPARTVFERKVLEFFLDKNVSVVIAGGKKDMSFGTGNIDYVGLASREEMETIINCSDKIIARAGYSTIMDLWKMNKKAVLIPTPKQTEQEYLAKYLSKKHPEQFIFLQEKDLYLLQV